MADIKWYEKLLMGVTLISGLLTTIITNTPLAKIILWYWISSVSALVCVTAFPICMFCIWLRRRLAKSHGKYAK